MSVKELTAPDAINEKQVGYSIRPGYKQTELGLLPSEWEVKTLSQIGLIKTGPFGTLLKASEYSEVGGVPLISVGEIRNGYILITDETPRVCEIVTKRLPEYLLWEGDVVFGRKGAVDRSAMINESQAGWFLGSDGIRFRPHDTFFAKYLAYQFQSALVQSHLLRHAIGTTMPSLNHGVLGSAVVPVPSCKAEQEAIAEALGDADSLVESLERLLAKKRHLKQAAMQQLLTGKKRLPGFDGAWETKPLSEFGSFLKGSGVKKDDSMSGNLPCVRYGEIYTSHNDCVRQFRSFISRDVASAATRLFKGDLLFAGSGETRDEIGKCVAFTDEFEAYAGGDIVILRTKSDDAMFFGYYLNSDPIRVQKASKGQGDAVVHIGSTALCSITCVVPQYDERRAIATVLSDMDEEIVAIESKITKARQIKQGIMQELLTGKIRLI